MKTLTIQIVPAFAVTLLFAAWAATVQADIENPSAYQFFGVSSGYNNVVFGDFTGGYGRTGTEAGYMTGGDIEGHAAIQGNVKVQKFAFGSGQMGLHQGKDVLVVGGNFRGSGTDVYDGNAYIAGQVTHNSEYTGDKWNVIGASKNRIDAYNKLTPDYEATKGSVYVQSMPQYYSPDMVSWSDAGISSLPFDFAVAKQELQMVSSSLWNMEDTLLGSFADPDSNGFKGDYQIDLSGLSGVQTISLGNSIFQSLVDNGGFIDIIGGDDVTLVMNIFDDNGTGFLNLRKEFYIDGENNRDDMGDLFNGSNILLNVDASINTITSTKAEINANLLAINSHLNVNSGHISGQTFVGSADLYNGGEFHAYYNFDDKHFQQTVTPEPATFLIFGVGMGALALSRRRRKAE